MQYKISIRSGQQGRAGQYRDLLVHTGVGATVGDLAASLIGSPADGPRTLRIVLPTEDTPRTLAPSMLVEDSALCSGCVVEVVAAGSVVPEVRDPYRAFVRLIAGPDAGRVFGIGGGTSPIGREHGSLVRFAADDLVSRRHAVLTVGEAIAITDRNSANGVFVDGRLVERAILAPGAEVQIGRTRFRVERCPPPPDDPWHAGGPIIIAGGEPFSRSPVVVPADRDTTVQLPPPPQEPAAARLPIVALLGPMMPTLLLGMTTGAGSTMLMGASSTVLMGAAWIEERVRLRRRRRAERTRFDTAVQRAVDSLEEACGREVRARLAAAPSTAAVRDAMQARGRLLWCRTPEHRDFLTVRLGTGTGAERSRAVPPDASIGGADGDRLRAIAESYGALSPVPVTARFERAGCIGVAGHGALAADRARALVLQLAGLHSPAVLTIAALAAGASTGEWAWLKWLPHVDSRHRPFRCGGLAATCAEGAVLVGALRALLRARKRDGDARVPAVVLIVTGEAPAERSQLVELAQDGPALGVFVLWVAGDVRALPSACGVVVDATSGGAGTAGFVATGRSVALIDAEQCDSATATLAARWIAPLVDVCARVEGRGDLPARVGIADLHDDEVLDDASAIHARWTRHAAEGGDLPGLRATVGHDGTTGVVLDLRRDGPHALVGGTTGSGKSEFLQTWVLGLAVEHDPDRVTFLLVDYKGGAAFGKCAQLPHTVGVVTDLDARLVRRVLTSLRAELRHRERLLAQHGATDILHLGLIAKQTAPPALIIVIDEFAALLAEIPEFVDGVIDIAQRGRSLGLHLIMATQRPSGVISGAIAANTNLRIALRVADEADSVDVVGVPDAAHSDPTVPGRVIARSGQERPHRFQSAYVGGRTAARRDIAAVEVRELPFGPGPGSIRSEPVRTADAGAALGERDIDRLTATIVACARAGGWAEPRRPWLDPLRDRIDIASLPMPEAAMLPIGVCDEPQRQRQRPFVLDFESAGNVVVLGASGSGKSALLRTIAVQASMAASANPANPAVVHAIGAAAGLRALEPLPSVGTVIDVGDSERLGRLLDELGETIADRGRRFAAARVDSLRAYRCVSGASDPPVLVLLDGVGAFRDAYEFSVTAEGVFDRFCAVATTGRAAGVHVVVTAERPVAIPSSIAASAGVRIVFRLSGEAEYALAGVPAEGFAGAPPGRGLVGEHEVQIAVPGGTPDLSAQALAIERVAADLRSAGVSDVPAIPRLTERVDSRSLPASVEGMPTIGIAGDTLEAVGIRSDGLFLVCGPFGAGRTTTIRTLVRAVTTAFPSWHTHLVAAVRSDLADAAAWTSASFTERDSEASASAVIESLESGTVEGSLVVIDDVGAFAGTSAEPGIARVVRAARRSGALVIADVNTVTANGAWQLCNELKTARAGIALRTDPGDCQSFLRVTVPVESGILPPGRGHLVDSGRVRRVQVAFTPPRPGS